MQNSISNHFQSKIFLYLTAIGNTKDIEYKKGKCIKIVEKLVEIQSAERKKILFLQMKVVKFLPYYQP